MVIWEKKSLSGHEFFYFEFYLHRQFKNPTPYPWSGDYRAEVCSMSTQHWIWTARIACVGRRFSLAWLYGFLHDQDARKDFFSTRFTSLNLAEDEFDLSRRRVDFLQRNPSPKTVAAVFNPRLSVNWVDSSPIYWQFDKRCGRIKSPITWSSGYA